MKTADVEINKNDYNLASAILLSIVDEFHVTRGYLILFEFDGNDKLLKYFNDFECFKINY